MATSSPLFNQEAFTQLSEAETRKFQQEIVAEPLNAIIPADAKAAPAISHLLVIY